jgi:hypothetical protein
VLPELISGFSLGLSLRIGDGGWPLKPDYPALSVSESFSAALIRFSRKLVGLTVNLG